MMNTKHSAFKRTLSVVLSLSMMCTMLAGCADSGEATHTTDRSSEIEPEEITEANTERIVETVVAEIIDELSRETDNEAVLPTRWEDCLGDVETFVYGLMANELKYKYDVFNAYVELLDGTCVSGMAYTDYSECYVSDDGNIYCFESGFMPFNGEVDVPEEDFDSGLVLHDADYSDPKASFVWAYGSLPYREHCVVYGKYVQYGVDDSGKIFYEASDYVRGQCDESLGTLYSYDESRCLYDEDVGTYVCVTGESLYEQIDYGDLQSEIDRILETQDAASVSAEVETYAYMAQEAVISYLLSLQSETFLGYDVMELVDAANSLDPMDCFLMTEDGIAAIPINHEWGATELTKWLVGSGCVIVTITSLIGSTVFIECPPLSSLSGATAGLAIEIFMEVVISGKALDDVDWNRVAISAATGAVSGFLGPYIQASCSGIGYFFIDSSLDGILGGMEHAAIAWIDGKDGKDVIDEFGYGAALGFGLSGGFKLLGKGAGLLFGGIGKVTSHLNERFFPNLKGKVSALKLVKYVSKKTEELSNVIYSWKEVADSTRFHSEYISRKMAQKQLQRLIKEGSEELAEKSLQQLSKTDLVNADGNIISKDAIKKLFDEADDGKVIAYIKKGDELVEVVKKNGMAGISFDSSKYQTAEIPGGLIDDRKINFEEAAKMFKKQWLENPDSIPESIAEAIKKSDIELEDMMPGDLVTLIKKSDLVMHENIDMTTITLVSRSLHEEISHMGGYGLAKFIKSHLGTEFFDRIVSAVSTFAVQAET